jgi:hypothetical protein
LTVPEPFDILIVKEVKTMQSWLEKEDSRVWGFEWDDPDKAVKEMEREVFGSERESDSKFCFECGELKENGNRKSQATYCPFCGQNYEKSEEAKRHLAQVIDIVWPLWSVQQQVDFKRMIKRLRAVSPEFRAMWEHEANHAALLRRYA